MSAIFVPEKTLQASLLEMGHSIEQGSTTDVWPPPDIIISVSTSVDATLGHEYRNNYFICQKDGGDAPMIGSLPQYRLPHIWEAAIATFVTPSFFLLGPFRWACRQLTRYDRIVVWPRSKYRISGSWFVQEWDRKNVPRLLSLLSTAAGDGNIGAVSLSTSSKAHCMILVEIANYVGTSDFDMWVSSDNMREVYLLHHHDVVVASVPEYAKRQTILQACAMLGSGLIDASNYS
jgi:hypothetical protein